MLYYKMSPYTYKEIIFTHMTFTGIVVIDVVCKEVMLCDFSGIIMYMMINGQLPFSMPYNDEYMKLRMLQQIQKGLASYHDRQMQNLTAGRTKYLTTGRTMNLTTCRTKNLTTGRINNLTIGGLNTSS